MLPSDYDWTPEPCPCWCGNDIPPGKELYANDDVHGLSPLCYECWKKRNAEIEKEERHRG